MKHRVLAEGFEVSAMGLGCMGMSEFYGPRDDETSLRVLSEAVERGIDLLDTADMYGPHHNEALIGRFLATRRGQVKVATKFGIVRQHGEYRRTLDNSARYARQSCEGSLRRLRIEVLPHLALGHHQAGELAAAGVDVAQRGDRGVAVDREQHGRVQAAVCRQRRDARGEAADQAGHAGTVAAGITHRAELVDREKAVAASDPALDELLQPDVLSLMAAGEL